MTINLLQNTLTHNDIATANGFQDLFKNEDAAVLLLTIKLHVTYTRSLIERLPFYICVGKVAKNPDYVFFRRIDVGSRVRHQQRPPSFAESTFPVISSTRNLLLKNYSKAF